jgi:sec-independent protein translocase protein TatA
MGPGWLQILIVVVLVILLFGAGRLPRIMEDIAKGIKSFKKGMNEDDTPKDKKED